METADSIPLLLTSKLSIEHLHSYFLAYLLLQVCQVYKAKYEEVTERLQREISPGPAQVPRNAGHHPDTQGGLPGPPDLR